MSRRNQRGNTAIEFALTIPVFCVMVLGMIDIGWLYYHQSALDAAASDGCRAGALEDPGRNNTELATVKTVAEDALLAALKANGGGDCSDCSITVDTFGDTPGTSLICEVSRNFTPIAGMVLNDRTLHSTMVVRLEYQRD